MTLLEFYQKAYIAARPHPCADCLIFWFAWATRADVKLPPIRGRREI